MAITFKQLGGPFKTYTATNESDVRVATIRRVAHPRFGKMWGVNSRKLNGWRYFKTVREAKSQIIEVEHDA